MKNKSKIAAIPLQEAVEKLHHFNETCSENTDSALPRTMQLMRRMLVSDHNGHLEHQDVLLAVEVLKNHMPQIFQMKEGTPHQRKLAISALEVIERYNAISEQFEKINDSFRLRIASYITGKGVLAKLPKIEYASQRTTSVKTSKFMEGLRPVKKRAIPHLSQQASELFFMKVISLLESRLLVSSSEARQLVGESLISVKIAETKTHCTVSCEVTLSPESSLLIDGDFVCDSKTGLYSFPATQGFRVRA